MALWINGVKDREAFDATIIYTTSTTAYFFFIPGKGDTYFNGLVQDIQLWNRCLPTRTKWNMCFMRKGKEEGLSCYVNFKNASNTNLSGKPDYDPEYFLNYQLTDFYDQDFQGVLSLENDSPAVKESGNYQYLRCENANSLRLEETSISMEAWIKTSDMPDHWNAIVTMEDSYQLRLSKDGKLNCLVSSNRTGVFGKTDLRDGMWHHVVGVYHFPKKQLQVFVDGQKDGELGDVEAPSYEHNHFAIGMDARASETTLFTGLLKEVAVWNMEMNEEHCKEHMYRRLLGIHPMLRGYYKPGNTLSKEVEESHFLT